MKDLKHTPAPWKCYPVSARISNNNRTFEIHGFETETYVRDVLPTEIEANTKLIASAPELLEALIEAKNKLVVLDNNTPQLHSAETEQLIEKIDLLIKKATE